MADVCSRIYVPLFYDSIVIRADANARDRLTRSVRAALVIVRGRRADKGTVFVSCSSLKGALWTSSNTRRNVGGAGFRGATGRSAKVSTDPLNLYGQLIGLAAALGVAVMRSCVKIIHEKFFVKGECLSTLKTWFNLCINGDMSYCSSNAVGNGDGAFYRCVKWYRA